MLAKVAIIESTENWRTALSCAAAHERAVLQFSVDSATFGTEQPNQVYTHSAVITFAI